MKYKTRPGYMTIKEASVQYQVSRAKLHRLIRSGRVQAEKDLRDERATLLNIEELESLFRFPQEATMDTKINRATSFVRASADHRAGRMTTEWRARIDALRLRVSAGRSLAEDSVDIIREGRERRTTELYGESPDSNVSDKPAGHRS